METTFVKEYITDSMVELINIVTWKKHLELLRLVKNCNEYLDREFVLLTKAFHFT